MLASQNPASARWVHAGREAEGLRFGRTLIDVFDRERVDHVIVNAAGCGSTLKDYADLLADDPVYRGRARAFSDRSLDVSEFLAQVGTQATYHPLPVTIAYHDACHLAHAQGVRAQPRELLRAIPQLELREITEGELCCGSAGVYNILNPQAADELGDRKAGHVVATGADLLVTANPGCLMQITAGLQRQGAAMRLAHTVQVLDASIRGLGVESIGT